jgi:hypothetical protein
MHTSATTPDVRGLGRALRGAGLKPIPQHADHRGNGCRPHDALPADEVRTPAPDLFDMPPREPGVAPTLIRSPLIARGAGKVPEEHSRGDVQLYRLAVRGALLAVAGAVLQFPLWLVPLFACAAVIGELAARWRRVSRLYWSAVLAAVCAQSSSLFVTPFTWPLRFVFFFTLIGAAVAFYGLQTDDLETG